MFLILSFRSPGWRPTFKYYNRWLSLLGTVICLAVMFLMDYRTAIATYIIILLLYILIHTRRPDANWGSSAQSLTFLSALRSVQSLSKVEDHVKNYRPKVKNIYSILWVPDFVEKLKPISHFSSIQNNFYIF